MRFSKIFFVLVFLSFFIYGCADSSTEVTDDVVPDDVVPNGVVDDGVDDVVLDDAPSTGASSALDELKSLIDSALEYSVVYDYSFAGQVMSMTQYVKGDKMRMDMSVMGMESRSYMSDDSFVSCLNQAGSWFCFDSSQGDGSDLDSFSVDDPLSADDLIDFEGEVKNAPSRVVAGVQAKCFEVIFEEDTYTYCYSDSGIPLVFEGDGDFGSWSMIAKEFSSSVASSVFDLPAEISSPEDMMGAWGFS